MDIVDSKYLETQVFGMIESIDRNIKENPKKTVMDKVIATKEMQEAQKLLDEIFYKDDREQEELPGELFDTANAAKIMAGPSIPLSGNEGLYSYYKLLNSKGEIKTLPDNKSTAK